MVHCRATSAVDPLAHLHRGWRSPNQQLGSSSRLNSPTVEPPFAATVRNIATTANRKCNTMNRSIRDRDNTTDAASGELDGISRSVTNHPGVSPNEQPQEIWKHKRLKTVRYRTSNMLSPNRYHQHGSRRLELEGFNSGRLQVA